jgi:hypothetical protein
MRKLFTTEDARARGITREGLRWGERQGKWRRMDKGVWGCGPEEPTLFDRARAAVLASNGVASGCVAGVLLDLDSIMVDRPDVTIPPNSTSRRAGARRRVLPEERIIVIDGLLCTDHLQTLLDLAALVDDLVWEQALESALRMKGTTISAIEAVLPALARAKTPGVARIRRVLALRPPGAPPTGSLLETLALQLFRTIPGLGEPVRQYPVEDEYGEVIAYADLAWPELGIFIELDGEQHKGQPKYDSRRETAIVAATGWLVGRFTWSEINYIPLTTKRRMAAIAEQGRRRMAS